MLKRFNHITDLDDDLDKFWETDEVRNETSDVAKDDADYARLSYILHQL